MNEEIFIPIFLFGGIASVLWKYLDTRHKERMNIIEKGLVNEDLKHLYASPAFKTNPYASLKYGMLAAFIGIGILVSAVVANAFIYREDQITIGIIFLFGGAGLISFYAIAKKKMAESDNQLSKP